MAEKFAQLSHAPVALEFDPATAGAPVKVRMFARAMEPFYHYGFEGWLVHDFQSMSHKPVLAIDWEHDAPIGRTIAIAVREDGLHVEAEIAPEVSPQAAEVARMLAAGIPLESSIRFRDYDLEYVPAGGSATVNGRLYVAPADAPLAIVRDWTLTSVALCKEGYDPLTHAEKTEMLSFLKRKRAAQSQAAPAAEAAPASDAPAEAPAAPVEIPAPETPEALTAPGSVPEAEASAEEAPAAPAAPASLSLDELRRYAEAFGPEAAVKFMLEGVTYEEALARSFAAQKEELARLKAAAERAPFAPAAAEEEEAPARLPGLSERQTKLAARYRVVNDN